MNKKILTALTIVIICLPLLTVPPIHAQTTQMKNVAITIRIFPENYESFIQWILPYAENFHNFTLIIGNENNNFTWFLHNQTRIDTLTRYGEVIPFTEFMQVLKPQDRTDYLQKNVIDEWVNHTGKPPVGIFTFQPDTYICNWLKVQNVSYVMGYCFDQYLIDHMTMRGGWQLPYYASTSNVLMPENTTEGGTVILPWLTWDWIDSFTLNHCYDTHIVDGIILPVESFTDYIMQLIEENSKSCQPYSYTAFSFEYDWLKYLGRLDNASTVLDYLLNNSNFEKLSCGNFTQWFNANYPTTPNYQINFSSPHSKQTIEWIYKLNGRVARTNSSIVSYVNYSNQNFDPYLIAASNVALDQPYSITNCIDNSLLFSVNALGGAPNRAPITNQPIPYTGNLKDFINLEIIQPSPTDETPNPTSPLKLPCIIATATYGGPLASEVVFMRSVRDNLIGSSPTGSVLVHAWNSFYYSWSPPVAGAIAGSGGLKTLFSALLSPLLGSMYIVAGVYKGLAWLSPDFAAVVSFTLAATLSIFIYIFLPVMAIRYTVKFMKNNWKKRAKY
jgi:hypothetical protein